MQKSNRKLLKNGLIMTLNNQDEILENCDLLIEGDEIKEIGRNIVEQPNDLVIDCTDKLIMPGLINAHIHSQENLFKGNIDNLPLELWMLYTYPPMNYGPISNRLIYLRTMLGAIGMLKSGVTSVQDDSYELPFSTLEGESAVIQAYIDSGLRANVSMAEITQHLCDMIPYLREIIPEDVQKSIPTPRSSDEIFYINEEIIQEWNGKEDVKIVVSPSAPQRCDIDHLQRMFKLAEKYDVPYHLHICETRAQRITGHEFYQSSITRFADQVGILAPRTTIAHNIWLDSEDIAVYAKNGVNAVHNPISNLKLGSGIMPILKLQEKGINICLGTDGMSSNDTYNIFEVMKTTALLHKVTQPDYRKWLTSGQVLEMATKNAARSLMRSNEIGSLEKGKKADMLILDLNTDAFGPLTTPANVKNHLVYCENGTSIEKSIIKGKIVIDNYKIVSIDEKSLLSELRGLMPEFFENYKKTLAASDKLFPYLEEMYWNCINHTDPMWRFSAPKPEYI
ncbi:MAG: amidohydrolase family protein [Bacillota bacterium]